MYVTVVLLRLTVVVLRLRPISDLVKQKNSNLRFVSVKTILNVYWQTNELCKHSILYLFFDMLSF